MIRRLFTYILFASASLLTLQAQSASSATTDTINNGVTADIDTDAALSVVGSQEIITASVDNAADNDYELNKVVFYLVDSTGKETVIKTIEEKCVIAAGESKTVEFNYTRTVSGNQKII